MIRQSILGLVAILILCANNAGAASWMKTYGGAGDDYANAVQQTSDGGYIVAGSTNSFHTGAEDAWVLKLAGSGDVQWQKTYGGSVGPRVTRAFAIQQTDDDLDGQKDDGYIVAGMNFGSGSEYGDLLVLKLTSSGDIEWQKTYGGSNWETAYSIQQTSDGGYIVAGEYGPFPSEDFWILKLTSSGDIQWQKTYGGSNWEAAYSIKQTSDGGYIVAGSTNSFHTGAEDAWVLKLAGSGDVQWQKTYGGAGIYQANSIEQTSDGGYIVAGNTTRIGAGWDFWVSKLTSGGDVQWQKTYGGTNTEVANSIQQTSDGGYIVAGMTEVSDGDLGSYDFLVLKLTSSGDIEWQKTSGSTFSGRATSIQQTSDGGNIVAGHNFDTGTTLNVNAWVLKFDEGGNFPNCSVVRNIAAEVNNSNAMILNTTSSIANTAVQSTLVSLSVQDSSAAVRDICPEESLVPIGTILDWWRPNASWPLPAGYMICDGSAVDEPRSPLNGMKLPDLTGKFILGVTDINSIGIAGGNSAHRHQVPLVAGQTESKSTSHHHRWIKMQVTPLGDKQYISWRNDGSTDLMSFWKNGINDEGSGIYPIHMGGYAQSWYTEDAVSSHSHEFTVPSHETDSSSNLPPYVGLLKIMRIW